MIELRISGNIGGQRWRLESGAALSEDAVPSCPVRKTRQAPWVNVQGVQQPPNL